MTVEQANEAILHQAKVLCSKKPDKVFAILSVGDGGIATVFNIKSGRKERVSVKTLSIKPKTGSCYESCGPSDYCETGKCFYKGCFTLKSEEKPLS